MAKEVIKACPAGAWLGLAWMSWDSTSTLGGYPQREEKKDP